MKHCWHSPYIDAAGSSTYICCWCSRPRQYTEWIGPIGHGPFIPYVDRIAKAKDRSDEECDKHA